MRNDKKLIIEERKKGKSYNQLSKNFGIPKSTLSYWLKDIKLSNEAKQKINVRVNNTSVKALIRRNKEQSIIAKVNSEIIRQEAKSETVKLINNKLFLLGISLYWAEGYKKGAYGSKWKCVDFANSDSEMLKIMMKFFREICKVEDQNFKIQLIAHKNVNFKKSIKYWSKVLAVPNQQFFKTNTSMNLNSKGLRKNTLKHGTVHIRVYNTKLFYKIVGWIEGLKLVYK
jgi:hypothetical protein